MESTGEDQQQNLLPGQPTSTKSVRPPSSSGVGSSITPQSSSDDRLLNLQVSSIKFHLPCSPINAKGVGIAMKRLPVERFHQLHQRVSSGESEDADRH